MVNTYKCSIRDYELIKILGEGAFAKVLLVRNKNSGRLYAMKCIHKKKISVNAAEDGGMQSAEEIAYRNMYLVK
jgi:serine/threonine protein kinase